MYIHDMKRALHNKNIFLSEFFLCFSIISATPPLQLLWIIKTTQRLQFCTKTNFQIYSSYICIIATLMLCILNYAILCHCQYIPFHLSYKICSNVPIISMFYNKLSIKCNCAVAVFCKNF